MTEWNFSQIVEWMNKPLVHLGQNPVTLGGMGSAVLVFGVALFLSGIVQHILSDRLTQKFNLSSGMTYAFRKLLHYLFVILGVILAAQCIGLNLGALAVLFGFLSVGIGFGLQNVTSNFISGLILLFERPISAGDFISVEGQAGTVEKISMRATHIQTLDNVTLIVPNSKFIENSVTNWSYGDTRVRLRCPVGVAYGSDLDAVTKALQDVAAAHPEVLKDPAPEIRFLEFGDSSLNFTLLLWIDDPRHQFVVRSQINYAIDEAFRKKGIQIPFPQRDLHLKMTPAVETLAAGFGQHGRP